MGVWVRGSPSVHHPWDPPSFWSAYLDRDQFPPKKLEPLAPRRANISCKDRPLVNHIYRELEDEGYIYSLYYSHNPRQSVFGLSLVLLTKWCASRRGGIHVKIQRFRKGPQNPSSNESLYHPWMVGEKPLHFVGCVQPFFHKEKQKKISKQMKLGGGFRYFLFSPLFGECFQVWLIFFKWVGSTTN